MSKKSKKSKQKKVPSVNPSQADRLFDFVSQQMVEGDYAGVVSNCERLLKFLLPHSSLRADVLMQLGTAYAMLQDYPQSYTVLTEALELAPNDAELWFNRGMASRYTLRLGQSFRDLKRAVELNKRDELSKRFNEALKFSRKMAEESIKMRGPHFTLDQLIEQESLFQRGLQLMEAKQWHEAEQAFQASITMGDCLPQPWGNLGVCLLMQERYDEAEAALKRALVIDPKYTIAKNNLAALAENRRTGTLPKMVKMQGPFEDSKVNQSVIFVKEKR
jgi:tetratricopeptide (TPR) repeat protein